MQIIENLELVSATERGSVGALGNFDGVHQGHRAVIDTTRTLAQQHGAPLSVITFEPLPDGLERFPTSLFFLHTIFSIGLVVKQSIHFIL